MRKAYFSFYSIAFILLLLGCKTFSLSLEQDGLINIKNATADSTILELYEPYKLQIDKQMNVQIGVLENDLLKEKPESNLGNLCAHIALVQTQLYLNSKIDFAVLNYGGLRVPSIAKGNLLTADIYKLMPFDNSLVSIELDGPTTLKVIEKAAAEGGWPVDGIRFKISNGLPKEILINGEPFDLSKNYTIATIDYLANGGDKMDFLREKKQNMTGVFFRDAIIEYIKKQTLNGQTIKAEKDGRLSNE